MPPAAKPRIQGRELARALWRLGRIYWNLDEATEQRVYEVLSERLPGAAVLAVAERPGVLRQLPRRWTLRANDTGRVALQAA